MNEEFGIYSVTNRITGDVYIGQTVNFKRRWREHKRELNQNQHINKHLQGAWNKYGEESFEFRIIHLCDELDDLNELERYYIAKFNTYADGYNLTLGGDGFVYDKKDLINKRVEQSKKSKRYMRGKSLYSVKQIETVKILLCEPTNLLIKNRIKEISKLTGVSETAIVSIKGLNSWIDIREDLNSKMINKNDNDKNMIIYLFLEKNLTLKQLSNKLNLTIPAITYMFQKNNIKYRDMNNSNKIKQQKRKILKYYNKGIRKLHNLKLATGYSGYIINKILNTKGIDIIEDNINPKTRYNKEHNCNIKGISWDIPSQKWFLRITYDKNQIPIGKFDELNDAITVKEELNTLIYTNNIKEIMNIKQKYTKQGASKKLIKGINVTTGEEIIIEGIGVMSRKLNIPRKSIEKVLSKNQKTTKGYIFEYVS